MIWIDTHAHLDDRAFDPDRAALVADLHARGAGVITVGADMPSSRTAVRLAQRHRRIWATAGVHPHVAKTVSPSVLREIERLAQEPKVVAIGEIGLDYYRDLSPRNVQRSAFRDQLALARRMGRPIVLHNREATDDVLATLREAGPSHRGVVHSFLGDVTLAASFLDLGLYLGVGGPITYPANVSLREAVARIPLDRLLLETDCPYLTPVPHRGKRNEPAYVEIVAEAVAALRGESPAAVREATTQNALELFGLASDDGPG